MSKHLTLISHKLCPYVQRVAIVLNEKGISFERKDIDLANKPDWFLKISPLGKTPVLLVDDCPIFESSVICEYLEDSHYPFMHPEDALNRAKNRAWMEFGSSILNSIGGFYNATDNLLLEAKVIEIRTKFEHIEAVLNDQPYCNGIQFSIVDAVFGPVFRYFDTLEVIKDFGFFNNLPKVSAWRRRLAERPSVKSAVVSNYSELLHSFFLNRQSALSTQIRSVEVQ